MTRNHPRIAVSIRGGREAAAAISQTPCWAGFPSDRTPPKGANVNWRFLDWPFRGDQEPSFNRHRLLAEAYSPDLVVAPDLTDDRDPERVYRQADELQEAAGPFSTAIIVTHGQVHPGDVPDRFRVGIPRMRQVGDPPFPIAAYQEAEEVHLFGGGPPRHLPLDTKLSNIESLDTYALGVYAENSSQRSRAIWDGENSAYVRDMGFYTALIVSYRLYALSWQTPGYEQYFTNPNAGPTDRVRQAMPTPEHSKQDAIAAVEALVEATNRRATVTPTAPGIATVEVAAKHTTNDAPTELERVLGDNYEIETEATRGGLLIRVQSVRGEYQGPAQDVLLSTRRQTDGRDDDPDPAGRGDDQAGLGDF